MKTLFFVFALICVSFTFAQSAEQPVRYTAHNKGKFFVYWGGNRDQYSKSDITFKGKDYNFTIYDVPAEDRPKGWHIDYINPARMTVPQTNARIGYYISDHYSIALSLDHMKYVMLQDVPVRLSGTYSNAGSFGEQLPNNNVLLTEKFLTFEHTDGLNFVHAEVSRIDDFSFLFKIKNTDKLQINLTEGLGAGLLYPKTNTELLGKERHDDYNIAGYGLCAKVGLNVTFWKHFFVQTELKGGYINMQNIRTTASADDSASQSFFFSQQIIAFGGIFRL